MTNDQFTEWLESQIHNLNTFTLSITDRLTKEENKYKGAMKEAFALALHQYRNMAAAAPTWIPVTNPDDLLDLSHTHNFLILVHDSRTGQTKWEVVAGYVGEDGDLYNQHDDDYAGWGYKDVMYYSPVSELPPTPPTK